MTDTPLSPAKLWARADARHPGDPDARRADYIQAMRDAGYIIPKAKERQR